MLLRRFLLVNRNSTTTFGFSQACTIVVKNVLPNKLKQNFVCSKSELCRMNSLSYSMYGTRKTCPLPIGFSTMCAVLTQPEC
jgi:hypothetical protein